MKLTTILCSFLLAVSSCLGISVVQKEITVDDLLASSVMVTVSDGSGSGVAVKNGDITFFWTAAHVVEDEKTIKQVFDAGTKSYIPKVIFNEVKLSQEDYQDNRKVGETFVFGKVVRYSERHDLAVIQGYRSNWPKSGSQFIGNEAPKPGEALWHVGSMHGQRGANSLNAGIFSTAGRLRASFVPNEVLPMIYDQVNITAFPGSSGGGVFRQSDNRCIGLVTEFLGPRLTPGAVCIVPARRIRSFAKEFQCEWALGEVPLPESDAGPVYCDDIEKEKPAAVPPPGFTIPIPIPLPIK
jgi:hypothetical protein